MDKPSLHEMLSAARELPEQTLYGVRHCAAQLINRLGVQVEDAQNVWGQEVDEEVEQE